jgi:hypothetical protein
VTADTYVRARIDTLAKNRAAAALEAMGLSSSDASQEQRSITAGGYEILLSLVHTEL